MKSLVVFALLLLSFNVFAQSNEDMSVQLEARVANQRDLVLQQIYAQNAGLPKNMDIDASSIQCLGFLNEMGDYLVGTCLVRATGTSTIVDAQVTINGQSLITNIIDLTIE